MRFIPDGPVLPDELLIARDAGQVLFFCGAGVSRAKARLPDFTSLAEKVLESLGSARESPARRLYDAARKFEKESDLTGLVATDRIFRLLEREFEPAEVREAVAMALKPEPGCNLDAHRTLLALSRTPAGTSRLITTNFDLLFEDCEPGIQSSHPPGLPDPRRDSDFHGIIHLHGRVDADYRQACDDVFVLSSADFGHAYLSDGWATRYIQALLRRFRIVFVGYSANDPPVQYLLEALDRFDKPDHALYAFQSGDTTQAMAQWEYKGVKPIAYDSIDDHAVLWQTLSAWAGRARDVDGWHDRLITRAAGGLATMASHERGMIAHLAATTTGARRLAQAEVPLPADWLCVFDRHARYDSFDAFGLDSDPPPAPTHPNNIFCKRAVPEDAWDGMTTTPADLVNLSSKASAPLRGATADTAPDLPPRLADLGAWIAGIAHQPATLWWAARQEKLHPQIQSTIDQTLQREADHYTPAMRKGWRMLFDCWRQRISDPDSARCPIEEKARLDGWSPALVRDAIALYRPVIEFSSTSSKAPEPDPALALNDIVRFKVEYPCLYEPLDIPSDMLGYAVTLFRQQLEYAVQLESEIKGNDYLYFDTTRPDDGCTLNEKDSHGLTGHLIAFVNMMARLTEIDRDAARREMFRWSGMNNDLFTRLRIWSGGRADLTTPEEASQIFLDLDDEAFWSHQHERDLLFALRDRWAEMPPSKITELETRLCEGCDRDDSIAHYRLDKLHWLATQGVTFSFDYESTVAMLRADAPEWTERGAEYGTAQPRSRVCIMKRDTSSAPLENLPIGEILEGTHTLSQYESGSHILRRPFHGLAENRPARALSVITDAARKGKFVSEEWSILLMSESEKAKSPRMLSIIGHRLARLSSSQLAEIAHPVSEWLFAGRERLFSACPKVFYLVWDSMIAALPETTDLDRSPHPDVNDAVNRPAGRITCALFQDPAGTGFKPGTGLPEPWKRRLDRLLDLPGNHRRHAIVMIAHQCNRLFHLDPDWVNKQLLPLADDKGDDGRAFWAGCLWGGVSLFSLYQRLKPRLIALARQADLPRWQANNLAAMLLDDWGNGERSNGSEQLIQDVELRDILIHAGDELRMLMLRCLKKRVLESETRVRWNNLLMPFLTHVWPCQRSLRTPRISGRLAEVALALPERFPEIVEAILPRLVPTTDILPRTDDLLNDTEGGIIRNHPQTLLRLLQAILPENRSHWPYKSEEILDRLARQPETRDDPTLAELRRRNSSIS